MGNQLGVNFTKAAKTSFPILCYQLVIEGYNAMLEAANELKKAYQLGESLKKVGALPPNTTYPTIADFEFKEWEEEDISEKLLEKMKIQSLSHLHKISVQREYYLSKEEASDQNTSAKEARRIDFRFSNWTEEDEKTYFGEAKNVSCNNWTKASGANIQASKTIARYIKTGTKALIEGKYQNIQGFMIGYVVNGTPVNVVTKLNDKLKKDKLPPKYGFIQNRHTIHQHPDCYESDNPNAPVNKTIKHIFLKFS